MTAVTIRGEKGFQPANMQEAIQLAELLSKSTIVPKDYQGNPGNVFVAMQWGAEIGLAPMQAMQNIAVINGRPSIWGDAMLALVKGSGLLEYIAETPTDTHCTVKIKRINEAETTRTFSLEDAKKAGLLGKTGPWSQYPKRMLQMRARSWALRDAFPDVLKGLYSAEEVMDIPAEIDMGKAEVIPGQEATDTKPKKKPSRAEMAKVALENKTAEPAIDIPAVDLQASTADLHEAEVDLQGAFNSIAQAKTLEELFEAGKALTNIPESNEKNQLRGKYAERKHALKEASKEQEIDEDGVVHEQEGKQEDPPVF